MLVLVTRPQKDAERFAHLLEQAGHTALISPVLTIEKTEHSIRGESFNAVIITSTNALNILNDERQKYRDILALPAYVVGAQTGSAAREAGFESILEIAPDSQSLLRSVPKDFAAPAHFLYLTGENRKPVLEASLRDAGHQITVVVLYRAATTASLSGEAILALRAGKIDAITHFSRRSAEIFARIIRSGDLQDQCRTVLHACLSDDVAAGLAEIAPSRIATATSPNAAALLELVESIGK